MNSHQKRLGTHCSRLWERCKIYSNSWACHEIIPLFCGHGSFQRVCDSMCVTKDGHWIASRTGSDAFWRTRDMGGLFIIQTIVNMVDLFFFYFFLHALNPSSTLLSVTVKSLGCSSDPELLSNKAAVRTGERTALCGVLSGCGAVVMLRSNGPACAAHTDAPAELISGAMSALVFSVFSVDRRLWPILYRDAFKLFRKI